jgi:ferrous iron transport protein B
MFELESLAETRSMLMAGGWTVLTALNVMLFSLMHNPCSTTIFTIYRETGSKKWTLMATLLPLVAGILFTFILTQVYSLIKAIV